MAQRRTLSPDAVVAAAIAIADAQGSLDSLTLKAVAARLGVRVPSLYNHIGSLDDLRRRMRLATMEALRAVLLSAINGKVGREALLAGAHALRGFAQQRPATYPLTIGAPGADDRELKSIGDQIVQSQLLLLASLGLGGEDALHAVRGFRSIVHGFVALEQAGGFALPLACDESFSRLLQAYFDGLLAAESSSPAPK